MLHTSFGIFLGGNIYIGSVYFFNPIRTERFRLPLDWGGADCALRRFEASGDFIFCPNQSNMVSNDSLGLWLRPCEKTG